MRRGSISWREVEILRLQEFSRQAQNIKMCVDFQKVLVGPQLNLLSRSCRAYRPCFRLVLGCKPFTASHTPGLAYITAAVLV